MGAGDLLSCWPLDSLWLAGHGGTTTLLTISLCSFSNCFAFHFFLRNSSFCSLLNSYQKGKKNHIGLPQWVLFLRLFNLVIGSFFSLNAFYFRLIVECLLRSSVQKQNIKFVITYSSNIPQTWITHPLGGSDLSKWYRFILTIGNHANKNGMFQD